MRSRLYWLKHDLEVKYGYTVLDWLVRHLPTPIRRHVVTAAAVRFREPEMRPGGGYCGPDGITYKDLWENA